jgi:hypothetical protein
MGDNGVSMSTSSLLYAIIMRIITPLPELTLTRTSLAGVPFLLHHFWNEQFWEEADDDAQIRIVK